MVKVAILKEYRTNGNSIYSLSPDFENIENIDIVSENQDEQKEKSAYSEQFHLEDINEDTLATYNELKRRLLEKIPSLDFNSQRYYISLHKKRNFAFLKIRKKKIGLIAMLEEDKTREKIKRKKSLRILLKN